jgi:hypothetical protein
VRPAFALAAALLIAAPAAAQTVTKADIRSQSPARTDGQLRDQLWGIFAPEDERSSWPPQNMLTDVQRTSRPYPTRTPNLCRRDALTIKFAPAAPLAREAPPDASTPVRAYGVDVYATYPAVGPIAVAHERDEEWDRGKGVIECGQLAARDWFVFAAGDTAAHWSLWAWQLAKQAVESGRVKPDCPTTFLNADCPTRFAKAQADLPYAANECEVPADDVHLLKCFGFSARTYRMVVRLDGMAGPENVRSVTMLAQGLIDDSALAGD